MIRGTTPTFSLKFTDDDLDLTLAYNVYATFKQEENEITKTGSDLDISAKQVDVYLDQEESLRFARGKVEVQLNWTYEDGKRACSNIVKVDVGKNLIGSVLE